MYKSVYLKRGKEESLLRFHPWVFSGAIQRMDEGIGEGDLVRVLAENGGFIAVGHYQIGSIAVRVLSFRDVEIDEKFWESRLASALQMRISIGIADNPQNNTYRLVHGEGDNLPGLVIDCYGKTAVMQAHSVGIHVCRKEIANALMKELAAQDPARYTETAQEIARRCEKTARRKKETAARKGIRGTTRGGQKNGHD